MESRHTDDCNVWKNVQQSDGPDLTQPCNCQRKLYIVLKDDGKSIQVVATDHVLEENNKVLILLKNASPVARFNEGGWKGFYIQ